MSDPRLVASLQNLGRAYGPDVVAETAAALATLAEAERDMSANYRPE